MKRATLLATIALMVSLLSGLTLYAQDNPTYGKETSVRDNKMGFLILVNRLELTPTQMEEIHDVLNELLKPMSVLSLVQEKFYEEMLRFSGTEAELDTRLDKFQTQLQEQQIVIRKQATTAEEQLKGILTIEQGELLWDVLPQPMLGMRGRMLYRGRSLQETVPTPFGELHSQSTPCPLADSPANRIRRFSGFSDLYVEQNSMTTTKGISGLQQIVDILEAKLQYIEG